MPIRHFLLTVAPLASVLLLACATESGEEGETGAGADSGGSGATDTGSGGSLDVAMGSGGMSGVGGQVIDLCSAQGGPLEPVIESVQVAGPDGAAPVKGEPLVFTIQISNAGTGVGPITVSPRIDSLRFSDFVGVPAGATEVTLCQDGATVTVEAGPFLDDLVVGKHFAVGSGEYVVSSIDISAGDMMTSHVPPTETKFTVATSGALLVPVVYDPGYLSAISGLTTDTLESYLAQSFTRSSQIFTPDSNSDPDGAGGFETFPLGYDEMMGVKHLFRTFAGFPGENQSEEGWCEDAIYYGEEVLGMADGWDSGAQGTLAHRHGFDYLIALHPGMGGGVACWWIDVQVSGLIGSDVHRQQVVLVHESAHVFGAPHCDDVGNGEGASLQGYVMCSGEKHTNYPEHFVFHSTSLGHMSSRWN